MRSLGWFGSVCVIGSWAAGMSPVQIESNGRKYIVDLDSEAFQRRMTPAVPSNVAGELPVWLYPSPGATPSRPIESLGANHLAAWFRVGGTPEQSLAYYSQLLSSRGWHVGSTKNSVSADTDAEYTSVTTSSLRGSLEIRITYMLRPHAAARRKLQVAWYDDARALLCVRDASTREEFYVTRDAVIELSNGTPNTPQQAQQPAQACEYPTWVPAYPGSQIVGPQEVKFIFKSSRIYVTSAGIRPVYDFYKQSFESMGAKITGSNFHSTGSPPRDASGRLVAQLGSESTSVDISEVVSFGPSFGQTPYKGKTGIAVGCR
jgi:hypothetical protein